MTLEEAEELIVKRFPRSKKGVRANLLRALIAGEGSPVSARKLYEASGIVSRFSFNVHMHHVRELLDELGYNIEASYSYVLSKRPR